MKQFIGISMLSLMVGLAIFVQGCTQKLAEDHAHAPGTPAIHSHGEHVDPPGTPAHSHDYSWKILEPTSPIQTGIPVKLTWQVTEKESSLPVRNFQNAHEKLAHLIQVSQDLKDFSHLHPDVVGPGKMAVETEFQRKGRYILFLQFTTEKGEQTLSENIQVGEGSMAAAQLVPDTDKTKTVGGYTFKLSNAPSRTVQASMVSLQVLKDGKAVNNIEPYLGAGGHAVLLSQDATSFLHVHPVTEANGNFYQSPLQFHTEVAQPGVYKMWIQVQIGGKLETVDFTFRVT